MVTGIQTIGKTPRISFDRAAVVFDIATGKILHIHRVTVACNHHPGFKNDKLRDRALEAARKFVDDAKFAAVDVLHVEPEELQHALEEASDGEALLLVDVVERRLSRGEVRHEKRRESGLR